MRLARYIFLAAGLYGIAVLAPQYFLADVVAEQSGPINHPELFYGFIGVALSWQVLFLIIARDPVRFRLAMLAAILEKLAFGLPVLALYFQDRLPQPTLIFGAIDLLWGALFVIAFIRTPRQATG